MRTRLPQLVLIGSALVGSWLGMQAVHESGHALTAWLTGGRVARVVLHPLTISRTDLAANPRPLAVVWAGPLVGALAPVALWAGAAGLRLGAAFLLRFFAGFCLVANGAYVGAGSLGRVGDAGEMLRHGSPEWLLCLFGAAAAGAGLWLWHGQGRHFGLGPARGAVSRGAAWAALAACLGLLALALAVGGE